MATKLSLFVFCAQGAGTYIVTLCTIMMLAVSIAENSKTSMRLFRGVYTLTRYAAVFLSNHGIRCITKTHQLTNVTETHKKV